MNTGFNFLKRETAEAAGFSVVEHKVESEADVYQESWFVMERNIVEMAMMRMLKLVLS